MRTVGDLLDALKNVPRETPIEIALDRAGKKTTPVASSSICPVMTVLENRGVVVDPEKHAALLPKTQRRLVLWPCRGVQTS